jgi:glycosyltransferase involved in cell wall biosynthesis
MRYLGFKKEQILIGAYTANVKLFDNYYKESNLFLADSLQLLYVGRLEDEKGLISALKVIKKFNDNNDKKIKIKIVGDGSLKSQILNYSFVEIHPFKSQIEIIEFLKKTTFFLLPSHYEPWGVVLHEMAAAGIPIICSDQCGARSAFVINNYNGFVYENDSEEELYTTLMKACSIDKTRLLEFSERSNQLSKSVTPELWASIIDNFLR